MRIQHNIPAMSAYRNYTNNISAMKKNLEKLSSGYKINRAGDDAAGLAISEKMRAQITGLETAQKNAKDGISLVQTAEGALTEVHDMLNRMVELATQSANGTYDDTTDRDQLQKEMDQLRSEINRIADSANFNGIKLLDGSMDAGRVITTTADSAISEITTSEYAPKSASDAFESTFVTNRPEAATAFTAATFVVSLDDYKITGAETNDVFTLTVGDATISYTATAAGQTLGQIIQGLADSGGHSLQGTNVTAATDGATAAATNMTADWKDTAKNAGWAAGQTGSYVEINGNIYKMEKTTTANGAAGGNGIKFTQVNFGTANVDPNYAVNFSGSDKSNAANATTLTVTGTHNPQVQNTTKGTAMGSTHQAQVTTTIDFSKLKDGDTFTVGDMNYVFAVGKDSAYTNATSVRGSTATYVAVDLSGIFKEESDLLDATKQADAMVKITETMAADADADTWTTGNQGVANNIGTLTFQSQSTYNGENTTTTSDDKYIGGITANGVCDMRTEASVMKQFYSGRQESGAKLSFDIDVTKIKAGQTFTIDGKTFEFVDGAGNGKEGNVEIDLSNEGIAAGILTSQTATVMEKIKGVLGANGANNGSLLQSDGATAKYTVTYDGNRMTLSTQDDIRTPAFENRVSAKMSLPTETTTGKSLSLQIGDTSESFNQLKVNIKDCHTAGMGIDNISIADQSSAQAAVSVIKDAINYVSDVRGTLGATQNRLDHTINNLAVMTENIQDAESTIRDVDVAEEMMAYTKNNILIQSAQAMLAQANQMPQGVLQLLQ